MSTSRSGETIPSLSIRSSWVVPPPTYSAALAGVLRDGLRLPGGYRPAAGPGRAPAQALARLAGRVTPAGRALHHRRRVERQLVDADGPVRGGRAYLALRAVRRDGARLQAGPLRVPVRAGPAGARPAPDAHGRRPPLGLHAAATHGLRTAYIQRAGEGAPAPSDTFDLSVPDLTALAAELLTEA